MLTYVIPDKDRAWTLAALRRDRGIRLSGTDYKVGDRVIYRGIPYTVIDHDAVGSGSTARLLSDKWIMVHDVPWSALRKEG